MRNFILLKVNHMFGLNTQRVLNIAYDKFSIERKDAESTLDSLYQKGFISYPRTASYFLDKEQIHEAPQILFSIFQSSIHNAPLMSELAKIDPKNFKYDVTTDTERFPHRAITPTDRFADSSILNQNGINIYNIISENYISLFEKRVNYK